MYISILIYIIINTFIQVKKIQEHTYKPFVFHMCWTDNRMNKVVYFKDIGLWYLPDSPEKGSIQEDTCNSGKSMLKYALSHSKNNVGGGVQESKEQGNIRDKCCMRDRYWPVDAVGNGLDADAV